MEITVTTASNMSKETYALICEEFRKKYGEDTTFEHITDDRIIGGFIADADGEVSDLSIAAQLKRMEAHVNAGF